MDAVVAGARARGLRIFLDRHRPDSAAQSALWYTAQYPEQRWISDWQMLAQRYEGDPTVFGADLHNEPHGAATWGDGNPATDWAAAAERAGNAILAINPHLLIIVEGIERYNADGYWWGGNLEGVARRPLALAVPNQLVYSAHEYPASVYAQAWFSAPNYPANLDAVWHDHFGFIADAGMAPVLVGEFGTFYQSSIDQQWLQHFTGYVASHKLSFTYWCLNPDSGDTGGILQDDWKTVITAKQDLLKPLLAPAF